MKRFIQSLTLLVAVALSFGVKAQGTVTVANGTDQNEYAPIYGYYMDDQMQTQTIYPDSLLTALRGSNITGLRYYYASSAPSNCADWSETINVRMSVVADNFLSNGCLASSGFTTVWSGVASTMVQGNNLVVTFTTPFMYPAAGGNLLIEFEQSSGQEYEHAYFLGVLTGQSQPNYSSFTTYGGGSSSGNYFLPKVTFSYGAPASCPQPSGLSCVPTGSNDAAISWSENGTATSWLFQYGTTAFTPDAATATSVSSTTQTLTGLTAGTTYYVAVAADCGSENSDWVTGSFTTPADAVTSFPWSDDFSANSGWELINGTQTNQWFIGNNTLFVSNDQGVSNAYTINSTSVVWATRNLALTAGDYSISYQWKNQGESTYDYVRCFLVPSSVTLSAGSLAGVSTTATPTGWIAVGGYHSLSSSSWNTQDAVATIATPGVYQLVFLWRNDGSAGSQPPASINSVSVEQLACPQPTGLSVSNITAYTADFDWTPAGTESAWRVFCGTDTAEVYGHPHTFTGLTQHTTYTFGVQALCGGDDESFVSTTTAQTAYACPVPTGLTVDTTTGNSITISWTPGGEETSWIVACGGDTVQVYGIPYTITDLNHSTNYLITLWADCDADGVSLQSASVSAATQCQEITDFPWAMDFEAVTGNSSGAQANNLPACWTQVNGCTGSSYVGYPYVASSSTYAHSGSNVLRFYIFYNTTSSTTYTDQVAILPEMQNISGKMLSFWMRCGSSSYTSTSKLAVGVFDGTSYTWLDTVSASSTDYQLFELPLTAYQGTGNRIALCGIKPASSYLNIYLDDITVDEIPSCFHPTDLVMTSNTESSLTVAWTAGGSETQWNVLVDGEFYGTASTPTYTISGLVGNTGYEVSVVALCSATDESTPVSATFRTACGTTQALPYSENFNGYPTAQYNTVGSAPNCWTTYSNGTNAAYTPHVCDHGDYWYSPDGSGSLAFTSGDATYGDTALAILPPFATPVRRLQLSFTYRMEHASYGNAHIGYMVDGEFVSSETLTNTTSYTTGTFTFANAPAAATNLAILWYHNSSYYSFGVDDLSVAVAQTGGDDTTAVDTFAVVLNVNDPAMGTVAGAGNYANNAEATLTATPNDGYYFVMWNDSVTANPRTITVTSDTAFTAFFASMPDTTTTTCDTVTNLTVDNITYNGADLAWNTTADSCHLEIRQLPNGQWIAPDTWGIAIEQSYMLWGLEPETSYEVRVRAICDEGLYSDWVSISFTTDTVAIPDCITPTIDSIVAGSRSALLYWSTEAEMGMPELQIAVLGEPFDDEGWPDYVWNNPHTLNGLLPGTTYQVRMHDFCYYDDVNDEMVYSDWAYATFTTAEANPNEILVPFEGIDTLMGDAACGITIYDCGVQGEYLDYADGTLVLIPNAGDTLTVAGDYIIEEDWDFLIVTANGQTDSLTGEGTLSVSSTEPILLTFVSDGSTTYDGFELTTTCAGGTTPEPTYYDITLLAAMVSQTYGDTLFLIENEAQWSGAGHFEEGTETTLSVTPLGDFAGSAFLGWQDGNTAMPRTITVTEDATYTAFFDRNEGINNIELTSIRLYPNPASEQVTVEGYEGRIELLDMTGRVLISTNSNVIDLRALASGTYFVKAGAQVKKLIVK